MNGELYVNWAEPMDSCSASQAVQAHFTALESARADLIEQGGDPSTQRVFKQYSISQDVYLYRMTMRGKS